VRISSHYFLFFILEDLHLVLGSLSFNAPKHLSLPREAEALFRVRDKKRV